jgi:nitroimidazol reductase NimA-like FMN-containing flavoprotein (pyridoxamine 5'-phosphate oxidase superfamily)
MPKSMTPQEREEFLAGVHVGVLSVSAGDDRGPLTTPLWYRYEPGGTVQFMTMPQSRKAQLMEKTGRASLCVQSESAPYRYVTVEGPVSQAGPVSPEWRQAMHRRYLGVELADQMLEQLQEALADELVYELTPERWTSSDYSEEFAQA